MLIFLLITLSFGGSGGVGNAMPAPRVMWATSLHVPVYTAPQVAHGRLTLTSMQAQGPNVFALAGETGKLLWRFATEGMVAIPPTVGAAQVFVAYDIGQMHYLQAIDAATGEPVWVYTRAQPPQCMCSQAAILSGGLLFAQSDGHSLFAFAPSGDVPARRLWQFRGDGAPLTSPVTADGRVIFGSADRHVYALDARTGAILWSGSTGHGFAADPIVCGNIVVAGDQGDVDGFDLATGRLLWRFASATIDVAVSAQNGMVYVVSNNRSVYGLKLRTGAEIWHHVMDGDAQYSPVAAGRLVIVANRAGQLLALDPGSGRRVWQTGLDGKPFSQPLYWPGRNAIVFKIGDHAVGAFDVATGGGLWRFKANRTVTPPVIDAQNVAVATSAGEVIALR